MTWNFQYIFRWQIQNNSKIKNSFNLIEIQFKIIRFDQLFSSRNLSTAIFMTINNFWFFDRKHFFQTFRSYVQRFVRVLPNLSEIYFELPPSIGLFLINITNRFTSLSLNIVHHTNNLRSFAFRMPKWSYLSSIPHSLYHIEHSSNHSYFLNNFIYAIRLIFTSANCNIQL